MRAVVAAVLVVAACKGKTAGKTPPPATGSGSAQADAAPAVEPLQLPEVSGQGYDKASAAAELTVTTTAFVVDGKPVASIVDGGAVLSDLGKDMQVQPVVHALAAHKPSERFTIAADKRVSYRALLQAVATARDLKATRWAVLAQRGAETVAVPFELHDARVDAAPDVPKQLGAIDVAEATVSPETSLSDAAVKAKIANTYVAQLKTCLMKAARPDAPAHERVELGFTIDDTGHTTDTSAHGTAI